MNGFFPAEDIEKLLGARRTGEAITDMLGPIPKLPIEIIENWIMFQDQSIERFPGEAGSVLGVPLPRRWEHLARTMRPVNSADRTLNNLTDGEWEREAIRLLGISTYPVDFERQRDVMLKVFSIRRSKAKSEITKIKNRQEAGEVRPEDNINLRELNTIVTEMDVKITEFKKKGTTRRRRRRSKALSK
jgi:hypothetical protein